jgi:hypothetical protein
VHNFCININSPQFPQQRTILIIVLQCETVWPILIRISHYNLYFFIHLKYTQLSIIWDNGGDGNHD